MQDSKFGIIEKLLIKWSVKVKMMCVGDRNIVLKLIVGDELLNDILLK